MRIKIVIIGVIIFLLSLGCILFVVNMTNKNKNTIGRVELDCSGKTYKAYAHWICSLHGGIAADGIRFSSLAVDYDPNLKNALESLEIIPVNDDIIIKKIWIDGSGKTEILNYIIYDEKFNLFENSDNISEINSKERLFYIVSETGCGKDDEYSGYQYIFKVMIR